MTEGSHGSPPAGGWLPPEGAGEPGEVPQPGAGPTRQPGPDAQQQPGPGPGPAQPPAWGRPGYGPPPYGQPGYHGYWQSPYGQQPPWAAAYQYLYREPGNSTAMTGFILSIASLGALVLFFGLLAPITLGLSIAGTIVSRKGLNKIKRGETRKNKDIGAWGFWLGIAGIVLSVLAIAGWAALFITDPEAFEDDYEYDEEGDPVRAIAAVAVALARVAAAVLS